MFQLENLKEKIEQGFGVKELLQNPVAGSDFFGVSPYVFLDPRDDPRIHPNQHEQKIFSCKL